MSTKNDFKMFSEMYDNMYREDANDTSADPINTGTVASLGPQSGSKAIGTSSSSASHDASTALLSLQSELQKMGLGSDPRIMEHIQGISSIIKPGLSTTTGINK